MSSRYSNWLLTEKGRRVMAQFAGAAASLAFCYHVIPNSLLLSKYKEFVQMYRSSVEVPLAEDVMQRALKVLEDCKLTPKETKSYSFFTVIGFDMFHAGSTTLSKGPIIGIPHSFRYKKVDDIERELLLVNNEAFNYNTTIGQTLLNSIIFSERAQKFAIAKEIHAATTHYVYVYGSVATMSVMLSYSLAHIINTHFGFLKVPRPARAVLYCFTSGIGLVMYFMLKDMLNHYYDNAADKAACNMGLEYAHGGVEFYERLLERNRALRDALGKKGRELYTMFGNEEVFIRTKRLPVTAHLDLVKDCLRDAEAKLAEPVSAAKLSEGNRS